MRPALRNRILFVVGLLLLVGLAALVVAVAAGAKGVAPVNLALRYPWPALVEEADTMIECVDCHEAPEMHTCLTCHDEHGDAAMPGVPFDALLLLTGDVPEPAYIPIHEILPYHHDPRGSVQVLDFLAEHGVETFERVAMRSSDGGFVTVERADLTDQAMLMPHIDGVRFAAENLHVSSWLKGIEQIIVVGEDKPLRVGGEATSIGRLLVGPNRAVIAEQTEVMLKSEEDGQIRRAKTASRLEGAPVDRLAGEEGFTSVLVRDAQGREYTLTAEEVQGAILALVRGQVTLVLPERGRSQWIVDVVEVDYGR